MAIKYNVWYVLKTQYFTTYFIPRKKSKHASPYGDAYTFYPSDLNQGVRIDKNRSLVFFDDARVIECNVQQLRKAIRDLFKMVIT